MNWEVDPGRDTPPSRQILETVLDAVSSGCLGAGDKLPSVRTMASEALVNHNTVARAYRELEHLDVVAGQNGRGVFVTVDGPRVARGLRRAQTRSAFDRAAAEALRAGHSVRELLDCLRQHEVGS